MSTARRFLPSISALRALEAVERLGSASAAARELHLTQGAISRQLRALEQQLGIDLLERSGKRLHLTPAAQEYTGEIRQALNQITQSTLRLVSSTVSGTLNLAILPSFGMRWLMPRLPEFGRRHPDVTLNMATCLTPFDFGNAPYDAAIFYGEGNWPGAESLLLRHEQLIAVAAPALLSQSQPLSLADIRALPLLHIQSRPNAWSEWFEAQGQKEKAPIDGSTYDQFSTIIQATLHGLGAALLPDYLIEQDLAQGRLKPLYGSSTPARGAYYLVWPRTKSRAPTLRLFRDWLAEQAEPEDRLPR